MQIHRYPILALVFLLPLVATADDLHVADSKATPAAQVLPEDLTTVGLEQVLNFDIEVFSPSRKKQKISEIASAVFVLTKEDIRRSGATHVAEVLRLVPGLVVARLTGNQWAISSRGFNNVFANKLLVLVDGQRIFTPVFNGVFWDQQDLVLENIERIEVIRGPGAALWGANAVNGVINIITQHTNDTQGTMISAGGGSTDSNIDVVRHGGKIGEDSKYRVFGKYANRDDNVLATNGRAEDASEFASTGFRLDSNLSSKDDLIVKGEMLYLDKELVSNVPSIDPPYNDNETYTGDKVTKGATVLTRWTRKLENNSEIQSQIDYYNESQSGKIYPLVRNTVNGEIQHRLNPLDGHDFLYGIGYRYHHDNITGNFADDFDPQSQSETLVTLFLHDEITLIEDKLKFIAGSKFEHNEHTNFEYMPSGRLWYAPNKTSSIWAAVSKAVATPSRVFEDFAAPLAAFPGANPNDPTTLVAAFGSDDVSAESYLAYELGYRNQISQSFSVDIATFYNNYDNITTAEPGMPYFGSLRGQSRPTVIVPLNFANAQTVETAGAEIAADAKVASWWRLVVGYSYINISAHLGDSQDEADILFTEGGTPQNQFQLRSLIDLPYNLEFDNSMRYIDSLRDGNIPSYFELDTRLGWRANKNLDISLNVSNFLHDSHVENKGRLFAPNTTEIQRAVFAKVTWTY